MFKKFKSMKALRYLLIAVLVSLTSVLSATNVAAQNLAQRPEAQMQSTSGMVFSGSTLPQAAMDGPSTTYDQLSTPGTSPSGPNRAKKGRPGDWTDPYVPVGDAGIPLLMLAAAYAVLRVYKRKRSV